jgi:hypothetical protein
VERELAAPGWLAARSEWLALGQSALEREPRVLAPLPGQLELERMLLAR